MNLNGSHTIPEWLFDHYVFPDDSRVALLKYGDDICAVVKTDPGTEAHCINHFYSILPNGERLNGTLIGYNQTRQFIVDHRLDTDADTWQAAYREALKAQGLGERAS